MTKNLFLTLLAACMFLCLHAQDAPTCYRISLTDKNNSPYSISNPSAFLSDRAIAKRLRFNIPVTEQDLPINPQYIQQIKDLDTTIRLLCVSKWMNTMTIYCPDSTRLPAILAMPFVSSILPVAAYHLDDTASEQPATPPFDKSSIVYNPLRDSLGFYDYGEGYGQIALHNGHLLHQAGFTGEGMLIAVFDAGWNYVDSSYFFRRFFDEGQLLGTRDLMPYTDYVFKGHSHGTLVTSAMACEDEGTLVGTAPKAHFFLIRSEDPLFEQLIEEDFWAQAAEIADSIGADVINSSLGYTTFPDFPQGNYTYGNMDGTSSPASLAATILGQKGVIACVSAGNEGNTDWHYISHPADAIDILAVGAADADGNIAPFSSRGPSSDGRVKPDITSCGVSTACIWPGDGLGYADGTSLAAPVTSGLCACLWQALPNATASQVMQYVRESASCYQQPNDSLGYGIPDFFAAYTAHASDAVGTYKPTTLQVFPNPCTDFFQVPNPQQDITRVELFSITGKLVATHTNPSQLIITFPVQDLPNGLYIGRVHHRNGQTKSFKILTTR